MKAEVLKQFVTPCWNSTDIIKSVKTGDKIELSAEMLNVAESKNKKQRSGQTEDYLPN